MNFDEIKIDPKTLYICHKGHLCSAKVSDGYIYGFAHIQNGKCINWTTDHISADVKIYESNGNSLIESNDQELYNKALNMIEQYFTKDLVMTA